MISKLILWLFLTSCRLSEATNATWSQISEDKRSWTIPSTNTKAKKTRTIPLSRMAVELLEDLGTEGEYEYLFTNKRTGRPYVAVHKKFDQLRRLAGIPRFRVHDTRHFALTQAASQGHPALFIQALAGHADLKTTKKYLHINTLEALQGPVDSAAQAIEDAMRTLSE